MHLEVTFDFFGQSDLVYKWIHVDQWKASLQNQIIWVITYSKVMLVCVCVWFQINAVRRIWGWIYSFNIVAQKTLRSGGDTAQGWYFASHRLPSFLWQVSTLETASVDMYHFVHGTTHFTKRSHYHCYLLAFLFNITMVSNSAWIPKPQTIGTFREHHQLGLKPSWPAWLHCPYAGASRALPTGERWPPSPPAHLFSVISF